MIDVAGLARCSLLDGLPPDELQRVAERARMRTFEPGEVMCRAGEPAERCWIITGGLVDVFDGPGELLGRRRKGDTVAEVSVILGEPHSGTVSASTTASALELDAATVAGLVGDHPQIAVNALATLRRRLLHARARGAERKRGETVAIVTGPALPELPALLIAAAQRATARPLTTLSRDLSFAGAVIAASDLTDSHATVMLSEALEAQTVASLLREADRVVAVVATGAECAVLGRLAPLPDLDNRVDVVLAGGEAVTASHDWPASAPLRVIRSCADGLGPGDIAWIGRHLTRTKLGLALGAGGAKGYAHLGVLEVLEEAGYVVDYVSGSSIGAIVATQMALGRNAAEISTLLRSLFTPEAVAEIFKVSFSGRATGLDLMTQLMRESTDDRTFADTVIPLTVMAVDLTERAPALLRDGPLWEALLAATALAGVFPPVERDGHRLVDGLALVPVPVGAVVEDGADITVSVNLISRHTLRAWPGAQPPEAVEERRRRGMLDHLLEVMDLSQLAECERNAQLADVVITPRFGPGEWRDFDLADHFQDAGRVAAAEQLPLLRSQASPARRSDSSLRRHV